MNLFAKNTDFISEDASHRPAKEFGAGKYHGREPLKAAASIALDRIEADPQHREQFDEKSLQRLADSLKHNGQLQPIRVRWDQARDKYVIVAGERRWRAAVRAELPTIQCVIVEGDLSPADILRQQVIENALREDLKPSEQAKAFQELMDTEGWNGKQLAEQLHLSPSTVSRTLAVLKMPDDIVAKIDGGKMAIRDALNIKVDSDSPAAPQRKRPKKASRERKFVLDRYTVTVKARRILTDDLVREALSQATSKLDEAESDDMRDAA